MSANADIRGIIVNSWIGATYVGETRSDPLRLELGSKMLGVEYK